MSEPAAMTYDLNQLLAAAGLSWSSGLPLRVRGVAYDSRRVAPGDLFVAIPGLTVDGQQFAAQAVQAGASAVICQSPLELQREGQPVPCIVAQDARRALGLISARLCGDPSRELVMCGITGTNGKSTTAFLLREMLRAAGGVVACWGRSSMTTERCRCRRPLPRRPRQSCNTGCKRWWRQAAATA